MAWMHTQASAPDGGFAEVLARLPDGLDLDELARRHGALTRRRGVSSGAALLRLALVRGPGGMSLRQAAAWAGMHGVAQLSDPALKHRLDKAAGFLSALVARLLVERAASQAVHWPGRCLRIVDSTCIAQPGSTGADWRVHAVYDLDRGGFAHFEVTDGRGAEALDRGAAVPGEVRIGDRGYGRASPLQRFLDGEVSADFIVRTRPAGMTLLDTEGRPFDLTAHLATLPTDEAPHEIAVQAQVKGQDKTLPLRIVVLRKCAHATLATQRKVRRAAQRRQQAVQSKTLAAAEFLIIATSLPAGQYPADQIIAAYRLRWQIELAFKRLKSLLHIDALPTHTQAASRSWLYAHLIVALLSEELSQDFLESFP
jgi:hypothetical protein